ncbi:MAG: hypothetical protein HY854_16575 [Burkholderiales bacterium]|nr:hypothetical protein [Burkholderiales bacterium]
MEQMLTGGIAVASAFVGLFFSRFWVRTRDRFFLYFSASFYIEAVLRVALGLFAEGVESNPATYLVRLLAYGLILLAILHKNRPRT